MAAKKKAASAKKPRTPRVDGTTRTHRAIDARKLRDDVKNRAIADGDAEEKPEGGDVA